SEFAVALTVVAIALAVALYSLSSRAPTTTQPAVNKSIISPAYDSYLHGKVKVRNENREDIDGAIQLFEKAIASDGNFAPAYAELAHAYNTKAFLFASGDERKQLV